MAKKITKAKKVHIHTKDPAGAFIPAGLFIGLGLGGAFGAWGPGILVGFGAGLLAYALIKLNK